MGRITISKTIEAPVATVFQYVDDHRNTTKYMKGLTKWKPTGEKTHGKGSEFEVGMKAGPTTLESTVHINAWTENRVIGWTSRSGFKQSGKWSFKDNGEETEATFELEYEFGGGIAGRMLARAAEPVVRGNLERSVADLKSTTEKLGKRSSTPKASSGGRAKAPAKAAATKSKSASSRAKSAKR